MSFFKRLFSSLKTGKRSGSKKEGDEPFVLSASLEENKRVIEELFKHCDDFRMRPFFINQNRKALALYFDSLISSEQVNRFVLEKLMQPGIEGAGALNGIDSIAEMLIPVHSVETTKNASKLLLGIYGGDCIVLIDGIKEALIIGVRESKGRTVGEPVIEVSATGPQEGFVEDYIYNVALIRKRVKTCKMKVEHFEKGRITKNTFIMIYIDGLVKSTLVTELKERLSRIDTDGFIDSGHLRRFISDNKFSPLPQEIMTERPDRCVNHLLEGRIVLIVDGSPFALIYPSVFIDLLKTADEAYMTYYLAMFTRFIRLVALGISTLGSALYISLTVFNPGMIPTQLLITIASSRAGVPFPAIAEAFLMEFTFELLREASIRIPKPIGPSISIVGGLVIGQSVVEAGIASQAMIIVVALTSISSFAVPGYTTNAALRLIRFPMMFAASFVGIYGVISLIVFVLIHMASLRSLGIPYLSPLAPLNIKDIQNTMLHGPASAQTRRPSFLEVENPVHTSRKSEQKIPRGKGGTK